MSSSLSRVITLSAKCERVLLHALGDTPRYLKDQLLRSVNSIGANTAEGLGRADTSQRFFLRVARGSAVEACYHLCIVNLPPMVKRSLKRRLRRINGELIKVLSR